jgi:hypothetical protein
VTAREDIEFTSYPGTGSSATITRAHNGTTAQDWKKNARWVAALEAEDIEALIAADAANTAAIIAEASRAVGAETALTTALSNEGSTRAGADTALATSISNEATTRANADTALSTSITSAVAAETTRATTAEGALIPLSQKGANSGVATLNSSGFVPLTQLSGITATQLATTGVTAAGYGSASQTLTTTVNAQGQITAMLAVNIQLSESQVTSLTTDLANRVRGSTIKVAAVDASAAEKAAADVVCSGVQATGGDAAQIVAGLRDLPHVSYGYITGQHVGCVELSEGTFYLESTAYLDMQGVWLKTQGAATRIVAADNFVGTALLVIGSNPLDHPTWGGLYFSTDDAPTQSPTGVRITMPTLGVYSTTKWGVCSGIINRGNATVIEGVNAQYLQYDGITHEGFQYIGTKGDTPITTTQNLGGTGGSIAVTNGAPFAALAPCYALIGNVPNSTNNYVSALGFSTNGASSNSVTTSGGANAGIDYGIQPGMFVVAPSGGTVPAGTKVMSISGTTMLLNQNVTLGTGGGGTNALTFYGQDYEMVRVTSVASNTLTISARSQNNTSWNGTGGTAGSRHPSGSYIMPIYTTSAKAAPGPATSYTHTTRDCFVTGMGRHGYSPRPFVDDSEWHNCQQSGGAAVLAGTTPLVNTPIGFLIGAANNRFYDCHPFANTTNGVYMQAVSVTNSPATNTWNGGEIETNGQGSNGSSAVLASLQATAGGICINGARAVLLTGGTSVYGNYPQDVFCANTHAITIDTLLASSSSAVAVHSIYIDATNSTSSVPTQVQITDNTLIYTANAPSASVVYIFGNSATNSTAITVSRNQISASSGSSASFGSVELHSCAGAAVWGNQLGGSFFESGTSDLNQVWGNIFSLSTATFTMSGTSSVAWDNWNSASSPPAFMPAYGKRVGTTAALGNNSTALATTAFVTRDFAALAGAAFTGAVTAPTPSAFDNSTNVATTAWVNTFLASESFSTGDVQGNLAHATVIGIDGLPITGTLPLTTLNRTLFSDGVGNMQFSTITGDINTKSAGVGSHKVVGLQSAPINATAAQIGLSGSTLADAQILVYTTASSANNWANVSLSGHITMDDTGLTTLADNAVSTNKLAANAVTAAKIANATITGTQVANDIALPGNPTTTTQNAGTNNTTIATTAYADRMLPLSGGTMTGAIAMGGHSIGGVFVLTVASTGASQAARLVGATAGGTPQSGTFSVGDWLLDTSDGRYMHCTSAGTPGTWAYEGTALTRTAVPSTTTSLTASTEVLLGAAQMRNPTNSTLVGSMWKVTGSVTKTGAGTATWNVQIRYGTSSTATSNTSIATFTSGTNTGAADQATFTIFIYVTAVGSGTSATIAANCMYANQLTSSTGLGNLPLVATSTAGFDSTVTQPYIAATVTCGSGATMTGVGMVERIC